MPTTPVRLESVKPASPGLVYQRVYEWVEYPREAPPEKYRDDPGNPEEQIKERPASWWTPRSIGFRAKILVNPLGGELRIQDRKFAAWLTRQGEEKDFLEAIADRVIAWDYVIIDEHGERHEIEPPSVGGWERFLDLPSEVYTWLTMEIRDAHRPKATIRAGSNAGSRDTANPAPLDPALDPLPSLPTPPSSNSET